MPTAQDSLYRDEFERRWVEYRRDWEELLRYESISVDPSKLEDCRDCAAWVESFCKRLGFFTELIETPTKKPLMFASRVGRPGLPTILFYGHYDVQPVDPVEAWDSPPFAPSLRNGRMYARGAKDNKGQFLYFLKAVQTLLERDELGCSIKVLLEGEEECGSGGLAAVLPTISPTLAADVLMVCDTDVKSLQDPAIVLGLRGIISLEVRVSGPVRDLHSGQHGGVVKNPALELAKALARCFTADGSIAIPGYYDGVREASPDQLRLASESVADEQRYYELIGLPPTGGEQGRSMVDRMSFRPTLEVNGLTSGYQGPGGKAIIPAEATAKLSARVVIGQDPHRCLSLIKEYLRAELPDEFTVTFTREDSIGGAFSLSPDERIVAIAREEITQLFGKVVHYWDGASIPIVGQLAQASKAVPLMVGFGLEEDNMHAPNESFSLDQARCGYLYAAHMLRRFSERGLE
jgi:acetylornithine deacetylase/succinyl-diaminopimelate desuccinylase-like protein